MKTLASYVVVLYMLCSWVAPASAQPQEPRTLIDGDLHHGGFGAPVVKFGSVNDEPAVWVGGRGGWVIGMGENHAISLGGGGYGLATEHRAPDPSDNQHVDTDGHTGGGFSHYAMNGYGGFEIEYTHRPYQLVHATFHTLIGAGGLMTRRRHFEDVDREPDPYFVLEPGMHIQVNVTRFFRLAGGATYRYTSGIGRSGFHDRDFSGVNAMLTLKFGSF